MSMKDADLSLWLHNKLGQIDEHWSSKNIVPHLNGQIILNASHIFNSLQPIVKVRLLLSLLHITRKDLNEWRDEIANLLAIAELDIDQWCCAIAKILKKYPLDNVLSFDESLMETYFSDLQTEIFRITSEKQNSNITPSLLPLESLYLNKNALHSLTGYTLSYKKSFTLQRKPKSAILRAEMLQKASDANNQAKAKNPMNTPVLPVKSRNEKLENTVSQKDADFHKTAKLSIRPQISSQQNVKKPPTIPSQFGPNRAAYVSKRVENVHSKVKLLDITEQPLALKDKRIRRKDDSNLFFGSSLHHTTPTTICGPNPAHLPSNVYMNTASSLNNTVGSNPYMQVRSLTSPSAQNQSNAMFMQPNNVQNLAQSALPVHINNPAGQLNMTHEQIAQAQEIFKDATSVTPPERALILAFMSGVRDNPCPSQGDILSIKLSERIEEVMIRVNNNNMNMNTPVEGNQYTLQKSLVIAQIFFQMNYLTGEWKRIKSYRLPAATSSNNPIMAAGQQNVQSVNNNPPPLCNNSLNNGNQMGFDSTTNAVQNNATVNNNFNSQKNFQPQIGGEMPINFNNANNVPTNNNVNMMYPMYTDHIGENT